MTVHIIHTSDRTDRYELLMKELQTQGVKDYKIWEGVKIPGNSILGISNSHKKIVRYALDNDLPEVCIWENDVHFFAPGAFDYFVSHKPDHYDLYLGATFHGAISKEGTIQDFTGLSCYMVAKRFYPLFLTVKDMDNIDRALAAYNFNNYLKDLLKYYVCDPMVCTQHGGWSDNKQGHVESYDVLLQGRRLFGR